jgi:hypothetical protein
MGPRVAILARENRLNMNSRMIIKVSTAAPSGLPGGVRAVSAREESAH